MGTDAEETYQCTACSREFETREELIQHVRRVGIVE